MITIDPLYSKLSFEELINIICNDEKIQSTKDGRAAVHENFEFLKKFAEGKTIEGVNSGFSFPEQKVKQHSTKQQTEEIRYHYSEKGTPLSPKISKATMVLKLNEILQAKSGVNKSVVRVLEYFINENIIPQIYVRHVPAMLNKRGLSNIAKALIGEGLVIYENKLYPTADLMHRFKIQPIDIAGREGFALTSGTAITNSINSINLIHLMKLVSLLNLLEELNKLVHEDQTINITAELPSEKFNTFIKKAQNIQNSVNKEVNDEVLINHLSRTIENNTRKKTPATSILEELAIYADKACKIAAKFSNTTQTEAKPDEYLSIAVMKKLETGLSRVTESIRGVSNKISTQDIEKLSDNNREILQKYFKK